MKRKTMFLALSILMFSTLALASVGGEAFLGWNFLNHPGISQPEDLALLGAGLIFAARWLRSEKRKS